MHPRIEALYKATTYSGTEPEFSGEPPVTHVKVFRKQYPRLAKTALPEPTGADPLDDLLLRRRSCRDFDPAGITLAELARVLQACRIADRGRQPERRTYPSAGARFPVEIYPLAFRVEGLEPGCHHYDMLENRLERLWRTCLRSREREFVTEYVRHPAAALVLTAVLSRCEVKYGAKAYPYALLEAGHMAQNMALACERDGLGCCAIGGFMNPAVEKALDLTRGEIPLCVLAVGRPLAG